MLRDACLSVAGGAIAVHLRGAEGPFFAIFGRCFSRTD